MAAASSRAWSPSMVSRTRRTISSWLHAFVPQSGKELKDDDEDSLSDCETALACDDGSTFAVDFADAGGISGNGVPTPPGTTPTTARAFADPGTGHDDDAVCDDVEDPG
jgi:hypothetical protein